MGFPIIVRLLAVFLAALFLSTGASAAYGPVTFCFAAQEAANDCCEKEVDPYQNCLTDCCFEMGTTEIVILALERSPAKPSLALPAHETFSQWVNTLIKTPTFGLRSVHDPTTRCTRDQRRAELQVRLN